jgi:hypothetical protein
VRRKRWKERRLEERRRKENESFWRRCEESRQGGGQMERTERTRGRKMLSSRSECDGGEGLYEKRKRTEVEGVRERRKK